MWHCTDNDLQMKAQSQRRSIFFSRKRNPDRLTSNTIFGAFDNANGPRSPDERKRRSNQQLVVTMEVLLSRIK